MTDLPEVLARRPGFPSAICAVLWAVAGSFWLAAGNVALSVLNYAVAAVYLLVVWTVTASDEKALPE